MKNLITSAIVVTLVSISAMSAARADCALRESSNVRLAITYLSMVERGGIPPFERLDPRGSEVDELCSEFQSAVIHPMAEAGYQEMFLDFGNRTCDFSMQIMDDGRANDMHLIGCKSNYVNN